jgi:hypothetical protein
MNSVFKHYMPRIILSKAKSEIFYQVSSILQQEVCHICMTILTSVSQSCVSSLGLGMDICRSFKQIPENTNIKQYCDGTSTMANVTFNSLC